MRRLAGYGAALCLGFMFCFVQQPVGSAVKNQPALASPAGDEKGEVYTGTIVNMNGRMASTGFTLKITGWTSDEDFNRYLTSLIEGDQDDVLKQIRDNKMGYMAATGQTGRQLLVARKMQLP